MMEFSRKKSLLITAVPVLVGVAVLASSLIPFKAIFGTNPVPMASGKGTNKSLQEVVSEGQISVVRQLIETGAAVNDSSNELQLTALHCTMIGLYGRPLETSDKAPATEIAFLLLDSGAEVDAKSRNGHTPLYLASYYGYRDMAERLVNMGADIEAADRNSGTTPLHSAAEQGHSDVVMLLIEAGADIHARDEQGNTPLHRAAANALHYNQQVVLLLLENGLDINTMNSKGSSPLDLALTMKNEAMARLLEKHGGKRLKK